MIATSSVSGLNPLPAQANYVAAKHGTWGLVRVAAVELGEYIIRVCASVGRQNRDEPRRIHGCDDPGASQLFGSLLPAMRIAEPRRHLRRRLLARLGPVAGRDRDAAGATKVRSGRARSGSRCPRGT